MSKSHGRGKIGLMNQNQSYRNSVPIEEKRPSVFERLGTRRDNSAVYGTLDAGPAYKSRNDVGKPSLSRGLPTPTKRSSEVHERSRSRSTSPNSRRRTPVSSIGSVKTKSAIRPASYKEKDKSSVKKSSPRRNSGKSKIKPSQSSKRKSGKRKSSSKGVKVRSSSLSSEGSTSRGSSTSSSRSRSSSTSGSEVTSSSSSDGSSSSESSAPSIKLKPNKKEKGKKKAKRKSRSLVRSPREKVRHAEKRHSVSSSTSSIGSRKEKYKGNSEAWTKSPSRRSDSNDRSFSKSRGRVEKDYVTGAKGYDRNPRVKDTDFFVDEPKKRRLSDDPYGGGVESMYSGHKRARTGGMSPPRYTKGAGAPRRSLSPSPRRVPPEPVQRFARNRSPGMQPIAKDKMRIMRSPPRRAPYDDRRGDPFRKERIHGSPGYGNGKYAETVDRSYMQKVEYIERDSRGRDRFAPNRMPLMDRGRIAPKQSDVDRERLKQPDFEPRHNRNIPLNARRRPDEIQSRQHVSPHPRQNQLKIAETPMDRFDDSTIKQLRVNQWVDQTIPETPNGNDSQFTGDKAKAKRTAQEDVIKGKNSSFGSVSGDVTDAPPRAEGDEDKMEELSDFSDEPDDLFTGDAERASVKSESSSKLRNDKPIHENTQPRETVMDSGQPCDDSVNSIDVERKGISSRVTGSSVMYDQRDTRSLQSRSQTDDDILEGINFEPISDEELGEVENKLSLVDVFGVDWASLLSRDSANSVVQDVSTSVREKWTPLHVFRDVGLSKNLCGSALFEAVVEKIRNNLNIGDDEAEEIETLRKELQQPVLRRHRREVSRLADTFAVGPDSRALSARQDMCIRRCLLNLPPKNLAALDINNHTTNTLNPPQDSDLMSELLKQSLANYKNSKDTI